MNLTIKNLPNSEKPYEKLEMYGEKSLSNSELLAIIIKTGTKEETAVGLAQKIISLKGSQDLRSLQEISLEELKQIKGIGRVKAIQIKAVCELTKRMARPLNLKTVIKEPKDVANLLMEEMKYETREMIKVILLNTKNVVQKIVDIAIGNASSAPITIKNIVEENIKMGMPRMILVHNHPSGDATPSKQDIHLTERLEQATSLLGIELLDHIVIGDGTYESIFHIKMQKKKEQ